MITFFVLIGLIVLGILILNKSDDYDLLGIVMVVIFSIWLLLHSIAYLSKGYDYNCFVEKRKAFVYTLEAARQNGNEYETAAITKEVATWNSELAMEKYNNSTIWFDQYVDDRIEDLQLIK